MRDLRHSIEEGQFKNENVHLEPGVSSNEGTDVGTVTWLVR